MLLRKKSMLLMLPLSVGMLLSPILSLAAFADASPDTYLVTGMNLKDNYNSISMSLNGATKSLSPNMKICEKVFLYPGIEGGMPYENTEGATHSIYSWKSKGFIVEFKVGTKDGSYLAEDGMFSPSMIKIQDIDLNSIADGKLRVVGMYVDFRNQGQHAYPYWFNSSYSYIYASKPIGIGLHPSESGRQVLYINLEEYELRHLNLFKSGLSFSQVDDKVSLGFDSDHNIGLTLGHYLFALGLITGDEDPPQIDEFTVGLLVTLASDFNTNGIVDSADYTVWRNFQGMTGLGSLFRGDADENDDVGEADYAAWKSQFGKSLLGVAPVDCTGWDEIAVGSAALLETSVPSVQCSPVPTTEEINVTAKKQSKKKKKKNGLRGRKKLKSSRIKNAL